MRLGLDEIDVQARLAHLDRTRHAGDTAAHDQNSAQRRHLTSPTRVPQAIKLDARTASGQSIVTMSAISARDHNDRPGSLPQCRARTTISGRQP